MCIRDRLQVVADVRVGVFVVVPMGQVAQLPVKALTTGIVPVSYTHLRAHETVLDLVCRLLLEKKKRNTKGDGSILDGNRV